MTPISPSIAAVPTGMNDDRVHAHLNCPKCGYDVFGQREDGLCPECGEPVESALQSNGLVLDAGNIRRLRAGARNSLISGCTSGLCPGACLLWISTDDSHRILAAVAMSLAFSVTVAGSILAQLAFASVTHRVTPAGPTSPWTMTPPQRIAAVAAAIGLAMINVASFFGDSYWNSARNLAFMAFAFTLLAGSAWRLIAEWRGVGEIMHRLGGGKRQPRVGWTVFGWIKASYETVWLSCCASALWSFSIHEAGGTSSWDDWGITLAIGAAFGLLGYAGIWLTMIILHIVLLVRVRRRTARAAA